MTQQEKTDTVVIGLFLGFLLYFGLMEQQKQETERIREMRRRMTSTNSNESDIDNLKKDWQRIREDLKKASSKTLKNV